MDLNKALYVLSVFSDTINGKDTFHQRRVAFIAYKIAENLDFKRYGLNLVLQSGLIHDIGLLSEASKLETYRQIIEEDFKQLNKHAVIGSKLARFFNLHLDVSNAVGLHHTPQDKNTSALGSLLFLADNIEAVYRSISNPFAFDEIYNFIAQKEHLFNKEMFKVFRELAQTESFWYALNKQNIDRELVKIIDEHKAEADDEFLKRLAYFVAYVSDHITPFFENYSVFIKNIAVAIGYKMSLNKEDLELSALFSHSGYIFIPTNLLNSSEKLNESDFNIIKAHPYYTKLLLDALEISDNIKYPAVYHHEKKSKDGYPFKVTVVDEYTEVLRISTFLAALLQDRPYRVSYEYEEAKNILNSEEFDKKILDIALELELENVVKTRDEYYDGIGRLFL